ncbi:MAG: winged helix-turn-helix domain-containing protein [Candidatus Aenigmatarchaeota archaeon]
MNLSFRSEKLEERKVYADLDFICSNLTRMAILHLLMKSKMTDYSLNVEKISYCLGKHPRVVLHHLDKLKEYGIVQVITISKNGRRKIWGIVKEKADLIKEIYTYTITNFFTQAQLERACNVNRKIR